MIGKVGRGIADHPNLAQLGTLVVAYTASGECDFVLLCFFGRLPLAVVGVVVRTLHVLDTVLLLLVSFVAFPVHISKHEMDRMMDRMMDKSSMYRNRDER